MEQEIKKFEFEKSRVRILVVDDESSIREMISMTLKDDGWTVETAENGKVAFEKLSNTPFHIVMTDIQMPEMSGMELLEAVKKKAPHIEVMIMTSNASFETAVKAVQNGAYDYLNKPFDDLAVIPKKMKQVAEKILLRQQNAELMKRLKSANLNLKLLFESTRELNGILELEALRNCVFKELPKLMQKESVPIAWYERTEAGWNRVAHLSAAEALPEVIEGSDLDGFCTAHNVSQLKPIRFEYEGKISEALIFQSHSEWLPDLFFQEVRTAYEKVRMHERWVSLANRDGLTMLHNHRYFQDRLRQELAQAKRQSSPLSLILLDVDHFKKYNDKFGHPAGDDLLRELSRLLTAELGNRESDIVARYGGEEFVLVLPFTPVEGAMVKAQRIQEAVAKHPFAHAAEQPLGVVSVSIGVASFPSHATDSAALIESADRALYAAKSAGRNCVMSFDAIPSAVEHPSEEMPLPEPEVDVAPKTRLADVVDFGEDLPDPSVLAEQIQTGALPQALLPSPPTPPPPPPPAELKPMGDEVSLDSLMSSIGSAFDQAKKAEDAQKETSISLPEVKNESAS